MPTYVALLRGVNVKPRWVKMERLREVLTAAGYTDVTTHIQSGNVLLTTVDSDELGLRDAVCHQLSAQFGFDIPVILRRPGQLSSVVAEIDALAPIEFGPDFTETRRYVVFLDGDPSPAFAAALADWDLPGERAQVLGRHVLCSYGRSFHEAKLPTHRIWRDAEGPVTARDLKVVRALADKWGSR